MSKILCLHLAVLGAVVGISASCATRNLADEPTLIPKELLARVPLNAEGERMIDIRSTHTRESAMDPRSIASDRAATHADLTEAGGAENFTILTSDLQLPGEAEPTTSSWKPVAPTPVVLGPGASSANDSLTPPATPSHADTETVKALVSALPSLTGASWAEPYILSTFTASQSLPSEQLGPERPFGNSAPLVSEPIVAEFVAPPPASRFNGIRSTRYGEPELARPQPARLLTSEHEAE